MLANYCPCTADTEQHYHSFWVLALFFGLHQLLRKLIWAKCSTTLPFPTLARVNQNSKVQSSFRSLRPVLFCGTSQTCHSPPVHQMPLNFPSNPGHLTPTSTCSQGACSLWKSSAPFCYSFRVEWHVCWKRCATDFEVRFLWCGGRYPISSNAKNGLLSCFYTLWLP